MRNSYDVKAPMHLPCGGTAYWDTSSDMGHRCECGAVVGSVGQPRSCVDEVAKYDNWQKLGGKGWNYRLGQPEE